MTEQHNKDGLSLEELVSNNEKRTIEETTEPKIKTLQELKTHISHQIKGLSSEEADWTTIQILRPYASQLGELLSTGGNHKRSVNLIDGNLFFKWLNNDEHSNFSKAKKTLKKHRLISKSQHKYTLEYICCEIFLYFDNDKIIISQVPALKEDHKKILAYMTFIRDKFSELGTIYFESEVIQYLLQFCLDQLLKEPQRSVYSTGKTHEDIARELMVKRCTELLFELYEINDFSDELAATTSINIASQFFKQPMELKEAKALAKRIRIAVARSKEIRNKLVKNLLKEHLKKNSSIS